jgi:hypothetical protein
MKMPDSSAQVPSWRDVTQVNAGRSLCLMALGALVGLMLAGYALFTARGTSTLVVPAEDVALVNQQPVSRIDFIAQLQTLYGVDLGHATAAQKQKVLDAMIREELFVQRGKELDVASTDPEVRSATVNAVEAEIAEDVITSQPNEGKLLEYYSAHTAQYSSEGVMTVRDLVFPPGSDDVVAHAIQTLKTDAPTPAMIDQWHAKNSGKVGDDEFYFAAKIHLGDRLFDAARILPDGGVSSPIEMPDGIHVLCMLRNRKPVPMDFAIARDKVLNDYRNDLIAHQNAGDESFLRKRANVLIASDLQ